MKKFLLSLVGLFVALAANAVDYYLIGGFNNWALKAADCKFTPGSNGEYTLDYVGTLSSGFKINDGTWSNDAANFGGSGTLKVGETYTLTVGGSSGNISLAENIENPHLVFNPAKKTLLITGQEVAAETIYAIHGTIFDATEGWVNKNMTEDNGKWTLEANGSFKGQFGIMIKDKASDSQTGWIASAGTSAVTLGSPMEVKVDGTNFNINAGDYTFTFDPEAMTLLVEGTENGGGDDPTPEGYPEMYLVGEMTGDGGWKAVPEFKMETTDGITYTLNVPEMTNGQFKFYGGTWGTRELTFGTKELENGEYTFTNIPNVNTSLVKGGNVTFTLVQKDDFASAQVTISGQEEDNSEFTKVYLASDRNSFGLSEKFRMKTTDGETYTLNIPDAGSDIAFKFVAKLEGEDKWFSNGEQNIHNGTITIDGNVDRNMTLHTGGDVTFTLKPVDDFAAIEVTIAGQDHEADPYPPIYLAGTMTEWEADEAYRLATEDGHTYTITVPNMSSEDDFKFLGTDAHNYWFSNGDKQLVAGDYELTTDGGDDMSLKNGGTVTFTFVLSEYHDSATLNVAFENEIEETHDLTYKLFGGIGSSAWKEYQMTSTNGKWSVTLEDALSSFGIKEWCLTHNKQKEWISSAAENPAANASGEYQGRYDGADWTSNLTGKTTYTFDPETMMLTIANEGGNDPIEPTDGLEYYIHGNCFGSWKSELMTADGEGNYVLADVTVNPGEFGVKVVDPESTEENKQVDWLAAATEMTVVPGETINLVNTNAKNIKINPGTYTFTFNPTAKTLVVTGEEGEVKDPVYVYSLKGATTNPTDWKVYAMENENGKWTVTLDKALSAFGIMEGDSANGVEQTSWISSADENPAANANGVYNAKVNGTNWSSTLTGKTTYTFDPAAMTLTIANEGGDDPIDPTDGLEYYIHGNCFGSWKSELMTADGEGNYVLADVTVNPGEFGVKVVDPESTEENKQVDWLAAATEMTVVPGETINLVNTNAKNIKINPGTYTFTFNPTAKTLVVTGEEGEVKDPVYVYSLKGATTNPNDWKVYEMENENGKWTVTLDNALSAFGIRVDDSANGVEDVKWISSADENPAANANGVYNAKVNGTNWTSTITGKATYIFDPEAMTLTITGSTGISAIEAEEGEAVYFNLQGQRIANPDKGIYIRVVNGKATKVVK
ncbi:MAG: hypothetical protein K2H15_07780 [Muribaculaceae bacterium]|nr:hypothetical protein [Muribaculaceae bacterium]